MSIRTQWCVNYSGERNDVTLNIEIFDKLKNARAFSEGKHGYILRLSGPSNYDPQQSSVRLHEYFGGFSPSSQELLRIKSLVSDRATKSMRKI